MPSAYGTYGTPVTPTSTLPFTGNTLMADPGLFYPDVVFGELDKNVFDLYGQYKMSGAIDAPLWPSNGISLFMASIGTDNATGYGITGTTSGWSTTTAGTVAVGASSVTVTSATGIVAGDIFQIDTNNVTSGTTAEIRQVDSSYTSGTTIPTTTVVHGAPAQFAGFLYAHASGVTIAKVVAPFTHTIRQQNSLPSLTIERNIGDFESQQFTGCRVNKYSLKTQATNTEAQIVADIIAQNVNILTTPSAVAAVVNESPFVFAEASLTAMSQTVGQVINCEIDWSSGLKETYTMNQEHYLSYNTPTARVVSGKFDVVFSDLKNGNYNYFQQMLNGTSGTLELVLAHPSNGGSVTVSLDKINIAKDDPAIKTGDIVIETVDFTASYSLSTANTIGAVVVNSLFYPFY